MLTGNTFHLQVRFLTVDHMIACTANSIICLYIKTNFKPAPGIGDHPADSLAATLPQFGGGVFYVVVQVGHLELDHIQPGHLGLVHLQPGHLVLGHLQAVEEVQFEGQR